MSKQSESKKSQIKKTPAEELLDSLIQEVGDDSSRDVYSLDEQSLGSAERALANKKEISDIEPPSGVLGTQIHYDENEKKSFSLITSNEFSEENLESNKDAESDLGESNESLGELLNLDVKPVTYVHKKFKGEPLKLQEETLVKDLSEELAVDSTAVVSSFEAKPQLHEETKIDLFPDRLDKPLEQDLLAQNINNPYLATNNIDDVHLKSTLPEDLPPPPPTASLFDEIPQQVYELPLASRNKIQQNDMLPKDVVSENKSSQHFQLSESTVALDKMKSPQMPDQGYQQKTNTVGFSDKTVAVTGFHVKSHEAADSNIKVAIGSHARSNVMSSWGGSAEVNLGQAEHLKMAQEKILELERENEKLRRQNEELYSASEIIKERSDLVTAQVSEFKKDRDDLEESFKNEMMVLKSHISRKDAELQKSLFKIDELESRLKFDLKKIRVRERELENRLELIRAEKNAIVRNKDEQILDLRRKMDILQMEVESYRQKCVELNKHIETSQESFKRTTRALRLAMANLELQEENKTPLKKVD